jgi:hypothetical protein
VTGAMRGKPRSPIEIGAEDVPTVQVER